MYDLDWKQVPSTIMLHVGTSTYYQLFRAESSGAARAHGVYLADDQHSLNQHSIVDSKHEPIELTHSNALVDVGCVPFRTSDKFALRSVNRGPSRIRELNYYPWCFRW